MNATRILPDLQSSIPCEEIRQEINGNFILLGVFGLLRLPQFPITVFRICIFNRWTAGVGNFLEMVRLIGPDESTLIRESQVKFALKDPAHHATNVTFFNQIELKAPGTYFLEVLVDDVMKLRYPLPVLHVPPPKQGQAPEAAPEPPANPQG